MGLPQDPPEERPLDPEGVRPESGAQSAAQEVSHAALDERGEKGDVVITSGSAWRGDRGTLAALLYEGYAKKAAALHVDRETAVTILAEALDPDRCFVAVRDGFVVGVVGLVQRNGRALDFPLALVRRHFGVLRSFVYSLPLTVRSWARPAADELVFEALAVSPGERSQGIGTLLVERVETYAREEGYTSVGLEVTDSNHAAIRLYSRLGYAIVKTRRYGPLTERAGFSGNHRMRKRLETARCRGTETR